jgi:hypothetical protein
LSLLMQRSRRKSSHTGHLRSSALPATGPHVDDDTLARLLRDLDVAGVA